MEDFKKENARTIRLLENKIEFYKKRSKDPKISKNDKQKWENIAFGIEYAFNSFIIGNRLSKRIKNYNDFIESDKIVKGGY